jgi:molecular chaperone GrpE
VAHRVNKNFIYRQLVTSLEEIGLKPIDAAGKEFDPNLHHAVMHGEDENLGENIVSDVFQKGYIYHDMVVRHSMVKVVN